MATFFLLNKQVLHFSGKQHSVQGHFCGRMNENIANAYLVPVKISASTDSIMEKIFQGDPQMKRDIIIQIHLPETPSFGENTNVGTGVIHMLGLEENHILGKIWNFTSGKATINWVLSHFREVLSPKPLEDDGPGSQTWETEGLELNRSQSFYARQSQVPVISREFSSSGKLENVPITIINAWKNRKPFQATFSMYVFISEFQLIPQIQDQRQQKCKEMLEKCIETDVQLVSKDGGIAKCHRAMLAVSSGKLARKLKQQKGQEQVKIMDHLSLECINALLAYMYCEDLSKVNSSVALAVEVLEAAMDYQFFDLVSYVQKYLATKSNSEFSVDDGVKMFVIAKSGSGKIGKVDDGNSDQDVCSESSDYNLADNSEEGENLNEESEDENLNEESEDESLSTDNGGSSKNELRSEMGTRGEKRITNAENGNGKRYCTRDEGPVRLYGKNISLLRQDSDPSNDNSTEASETEDPAQNNTIAGNNAEDGGQTSDRKLLEQKAIKIILWYKKNNPKALAESSERHKLVRSPELLIEFDNIVILSSQNNDE